MTDGWGNVDEGAAVELDQIPRSGGRQIIGMALESPRLKSLPSDKLLEWNRWPGSCHKTSQYIWSKGRSPEKNSCSFGFCPNEGGGPAQIFCPLFTNCIYWVNLGMGREGETPAQIFWHIGVQKKWYKLSKLGGGGGVEVIWTKSKRTATFFSGDLP